MFCKFVKQKHLFCLDKNSLACVFFVSEQKSIHLSSKKEKKTHHRLPHKSAPHPRPHPHRHPHPHANDKPTRRAVVKRTVDDRPRGAEGFSRGGGKALPGQKLRGGGGRTPKVTVFLHEKRLPDGYSKGTVHVDEKPSSSGHGKREFQGIRMRVCVPPPQFFFLHFEIFVSNFHFEV